MQTTAHAPGGAAGLRPTLGTGNHFIEVCLDESDRVWFMLHSGSRGVGNKIGTYFIELPKQHMRQHLANLPDEDLAYLEEGAAHFDHYVEAVGWAQDYAMTNRRLMMDALIRAAQAPLHPGGPRGCHRGHRVSEGCGRHRRDTGRLQADRRGDGGPAGPRGGRPHPPAGRVREGVRSC
jgi:hypothetical protein